MEDLAEDVEHSDEEEEEAVVETEEMRTMALQQLEDGEFLFSFHAIVRGYRFSPHRLSLILQLLQCCRLKREELWKKPRREPPRWWQKNPTPFAF